MDFSERFDREKKSGKKLVLKIGILGLLIAAAILGFYFTGSLELFLGFL